jgi:lipoyl(octanoyl) transferase
MDPIHQPFEVERLGRMAYADALEVQRARHQAVVDGRAAGVPHRVLLVEHPPVVTVTRRPGARDHVLADEARLRAAGVELVDTDRGGDVTYHGPGQAVVYPIVDLQRLGLGIHAYIRALEEAAIRTCAAWGIACRREPGATGVWTEPAPGRKIAAIGVRVSRSATMHGMALNVDPQLAHFGLIVPCGLHGRTVTGMRAELGDACPSFEEASGRLASEVVDALRAASAAAAVTRPSAKAP